jgi:hypothetical protein
MPSATFYNASGGLTFSSDGVTYSYIGRATQSSLVQPGAGSVSRSAGQSIYTIEWAGDIVVALPVKANGVTALLSTTKSGTTWTINVFKSNGTADSQALDAQEWTEVYVFGAPPAGASSVFMLYDASGNPVADLSRRPLTYKSLLHMNSGVIQWTPPALATVPAVLGWPVDYKANTSRIGLTSFYNSWVYSYGWQLGANGVIQRNAFAIRWAQDDGGTSPVDIINAIDAIYADVSGL